jgi:hypothetical protein
VARYSFEDRNPQQATDYSPRKKSAKLLGQPKPIDDGALGTGVRLDGIDDCLVIPKDTVRGSVGTLALWVRRSADAQVSSYGRSGIQPGRLWLLPRQDGVQVRLGPTAELTTIGGGRVTPGKWHHIAVTWKAQDQAILYVDGKQIARDTTRQIPVFQFFCVGRHIGQGDTKIFSAFDVDEICIYNRSLTAQEVAELAGRLSD